MKEPISVTVPFEYNALSRASDFLHGLAQDAKVAGMEESPAERGNVEAKVSTSEGGAKPDPVPEATPRSETPIPSTGTPDDAMPERDPTAAFGGGVSDATRAAEPESATGAEATPESPAQSAGTQEDAQGAETSDLDLDADGLPWDSRIHSSSKKKLVKDNRWKKRRKPADQEESQWNAYVDSVESELRRVMQAGPDKPIQPEARQPEPEPAAPSGPSAPTGPATPTGPASPSGPAAPSGPTQTEAPAGEITTLPELFQLITGNNISDAAVMKAINAQGIESLPLLGARPDLIPAVAKALQEG